MEGAHRVLIVLHAIAGATAFTAGTLLIARIALVSRRRWVSNLYLGGLALLAATAAAAVGIDWVDLDTGTRVAFMGLVALAGVMVIQGAVARPSAQRLTSGKWRASFVDRVGFTLIALFDGFVIVLALDVGAPGWLVALLAVAAVILGRQLVHRARAVATQSVETPGRSLS